MSKKNIKYFLIFYASIHGANINASPMGGFVTNYANYPASYSIGYTGSWMGNAGMPAYVQPGMMSPSLSYSAISPMQVPMSSSSAIGGIQNQGGAANNPLATEASRVTADWRNNKGRYDATSDFQGAYTKIGFSREILNKALNNNLLSGSDAQEAAQVNYLLNFVEMKVLIQEVNAVKPKIPALLQQIIQNPASDITTISVTAGKSGGKIILGKQWLQQKASRLSSLLNVFSTLFSQNPGMVKQLPPILQGLDVTYGQALSTGSYLNSQISCCDNPNQTFCIIDTGSGGSNSNNSGGGQQYGQQGYDQQQDDSNTSQYDFDGNI